jgi:hypothetical protein
MQNICSVEVIFIMMHGMTMLAIGRNKGGLYETTNTNTISWNDTVKSLFSFDRPNLQNSVTVG